MGFVNPILYTKNTERVNNLPKITQLNQSLNKALDLSMTLHDRAPRLSHTGCITGLLDGLLSTVSPGFGGYKSDQALGMLVASMASPRG